MSPWMDGEESSNDESMGNNFMDLEYFETLDTIPEPLICGAMMEEVPKCMLHQMMPRKCAAFEGADTGRRFYGYHGCANCGVVKLVDAVWPEILKNCLNKLWEMFS
nr:uncharacterized protein LOC109765382 [Aegilops tauschii subsp. strangulata]